MSLSYRFHWTIVLATALGVGAYNAAAKTSFARGGGGGGHGGGHEEHHEGEHHEGEHNHAEHHEAEHHPYHPSEQHLANHDAEHRDDHHDGHHDDVHWNHHHHDWHYAGWGWNPAFWGGVGVGAIGGWGGATYVDNSNSGNTTNDTTPGTDSSANSAASLADNSSGDDNSAQANGQQLPVDVWQELGISTYSGEYGNSKGLVVVRVMPHGAGDKAGLVPGDVILKFDNNPTPDDAALETVLDSAHGDFNLYVWDARTGRKSVISGALDSNSEGSVE